ncbi:MAG: CocE/NonD family hydrolase [Gemmatimonadota bacterium]|nr:MAG: CocE/NonD family hydrolase [Gemmatimonadota bacterium]
MIQYVRGLYESEGQFYPFVYEKTDGLATLDWINRQPWSDGHVGVWGVSYLSFCGFEIASTSHPSLKAMINISGWADLGTHLTRGGAFRLMDHLPWLIMKTSGNDRIPSKAWNGIFKTTPLSQFLGGAEEQAHISGILEEPYPFNDIRIPILHVTGWNDYIYRSTLLAYESINKNATAGNHQKIIIGPWAHNQVFSADSTTYGDVEFGHTSSMGLDSILTLSVAWFDRYIKGKNNMVDSKPRVRFFVMGENHWHDTHEWPPANTVAKKWYLADTVKTGRLDVSPPASESIFSFEFNPHNPVPTIGGITGWFHPFNLGVKDQSPLASRPDILFFDSAPLSDDLVLAGPIKVEIYASTDSIDTDFTAKLVEVRPDGYARMIEDGIIRTRYRKGLNSSVFITPNEVYRYQVNLGQTAIRIPKGNALRLEISSSNFPKFDRNPNTGVDPISATEFRTAKQKVYMSPKYPSHIVLTVLSK